MSEKTLDYIILLITFLLSCIVYFDIIFYPLFVYQAARIYKKYDNSGPLIFACINIAALAIMIHL